MKKLKDIFYDKNDILVALIIVSIAAFVIVGRIDSILAYPARLAADAGATVNEPVSPPIVDYAQNNAQGDAQDPNKGDTTSTDSAVNTNEQTDGQNQSGSSDTNYSVYIASGSTGQQIADILIGIGLMESRQQFYDAVTASGAETKLQAGNFIIPSKATPAEVVAIITR